MQSFCYPAIFSPEARGAFTVTFPDLPEAITSGLNRVDALAQAADCLQEALAGRIVRREAVPNPSKPRRGQCMIRVALYLAPKLALYLAKREQNLSDGQLARRLGCTEPALRRMLRPKHDTKPDKLQAALELLGKHIVVALEDAA